MSIAENFEIFLWNNSRFLTDYFQRSAMEIFQTWKNIFYGKTEEHFLRTLKFEIIAFYGNFFFKI